MDNIVSWGRMQNCMLITGWANRKRVLAPTTWAKELVWQCWVWVKWEEPLWNWGEFEFCLQSKERSLCADVKSQVHLCDLNFSHLISTLSLHVILRSSKKRQETWNVFSWCLLRIVREGSICQCSL